MYIVYCSTLCIFIVLVVVYIVLSVVYVVFYNSFIIVYVVCNNYYSFISLCSLYSYIIKTKETSVFCVLCEKRDCDLNLSFLVQLYGKV